MGSKESNEMNEEKKTENLTDGEATVPEEGVETAQGQEEAPVAEVITDEKTAEGAASGVDEESTEAEPGIVEARTKLAGEPAGTKETVSKDKSDEDPFSEERIQRILDIELPVNVSFGSTVRPLSEVLKLGPGALLELDRAADEPVVLKVNNRIFAKGEIVDVDGYYGVQITEISSPAQRIASLGD